MLLCECKCGNKKIVIGNNLQNGDSRSCGCLAIETRIALKKTHGCRCRNSSELEKSTYQTWLAMINRCYYNNNSQTYKIYGGRGIKICTQWKNDFSVFLNDMGVKPSMTHSIDRINTNGNYEPSNCRWATRKEQCRNKRNNHIISYNRENKTMAEWSEFFGITQDLFKQRINRDKWSMERFFEEFYMKPKQ